MCPSSVAERMIYFEVEGQGYVVSAADLAGVATACPFVTYAGLPKGICGVAQWSGKIFPVFNIGSVDTAKCTYLFSVDDLDGSFREIAIAVPGQVGIFFPEKGNVKPGYVKDKEGREAKVIDFRTIAKGEVKRAA